MNVSYVNEVVWLAPERCATQITKKIFENYDFFSLRKINNFESQNFLNSKHCHSDIILDLYKSWKTILNIRNPYDFVFSIFINKHYSRPVTKLTEGLKESFNEWVKLSFMNHKNHVFVCPFYNEKNSFFVKWKLSEDFEPNYLIRVENLYEDLIKLPFIQNETEEKKHDYKKLIDDNGFINKRYVKFNQLCDITSAKLIFEYFKTTFNKFEYDPFSFTQESLTENEKNEFLNGELD